jgi:hypothetical protein
MAAATSRCSSAWGEVARNCKKSKVKLSSPRARDAVLQFTAIQGTDEEEINKQDINSHEKDLEENQDKKVNFPGHVGKANIVSPPASQKPVFIRVRTLPGN